LRGETNLSPLFLSFIVASPLFYEKLGKSRSFFCLDAKERAKEKIKTTALVGEPVVVQLKALNSLRSNSRAFLTLHFSFLSPSSLRSFSRSVGTMLSQRFSLSIFPFLSAL
jgi:hypothetical protein